MHRFWHPGRFALQMSNTSSSNLENLESIRESLCEKYQCTKLGMRLHIHLSSFFWQNKTSSFATLNCFAFPPYFTLLSKWLSGKRSEKGNEVLPLRLGMHYSVFGLVTWVSVLEYPCCCAGQGINSYTAHRAFSHPLLQSKPKGNLRLITPGSLARSWRW